MDGTKIAAGVAFIAMFALVPLVLTQMSSQVGSVTGVTGGLLAFIDRSPMLFFIPVGIALAGGIAAVFISIFNR